MAVAALAAALLAGGCGQLTVGEQSPASPSGTPSVPATVEPTASGAAPPAGEDPPAADAPPPAPVPGPGAPEGCADLVEPLHRLATGADADPEAADATAEEARRLADATDDNALSAVARRMSGLAAGPDVDPAALAAEWDQVRQICVLD